MCPAPAPPPACGRLPCLDHSTITLPGSTRPGPGHSSLLSHHPTITTSQPLAPAHVETKPSVVPAQCPGCGEQQQPTKTIIPWLPPHRRRDPARQHPATTAAPAALYSVQRVQCVQYSGYSANECGGELGRRNVRWQRPPLHPAPCTRSPSGVRGPGPALAEIMMRRLGYLVSCILYLVLCCHIFTSYLLCARTDDTPHCVIIICLVI